jgi:hypothetical protein
MSWGGLLAGFEGLLDAFLGVIRQRLLRSGFMLATLRDSPQN